MRVPVNGEPSDILTLTVAIVRPAGELSGTAGMGLGVTVMIGTGPTMIGARVNVVLMFPCVAVRASVCGPSSAEVTFATIVPPASTKLIG